MLNILTIFLTKKNYHQTTCTEKDINILNVIISSRRVLIILKVMIYLENVNMRELAILG